MNNIDKLFGKKENNILSVYFTAGFPELDHTRKIIVELEQAGVDMIEIGIPFSDPLADGPVIQESNQRALKNGMNLPVLFRQLEGIRESVSIPLLMMGYLNPVLQFGMEPFCRKCRETGIDGIILPDLPMEVYRREYQKTVEAHKLHMIFLITPQTSEQRIRQIDELTSGFIYMVSASSTTGMKNRIDTGQEEYFNRISKMNLKNPLLAGFGISNHETFSQACRYARGAIIGSAFIKAISENKSAKENIRDFIYHIIHSS